MERLKQINFGMKIKLEFVLYSADYGCVSDAEEIRVGEIIPERKSFDSVKMIITNIPRLINVMPQTFSSSKLGTLG
jgi:hypothetical protein